jgi:hypothetical protein
MVTTMKQFTISTTIITSTATTEESARAIARKFSRKYGRARVYSNFQKIAYYINGVKIK